MKIKRVVLTALLLFSVLPMLAVAGICVGGFTHNSIYMAQENVRTAAMVQAKHLENFFEQREVNLKVAARLPSVLQFTVESNRAEPQMSDAPISRWSARFCRSAKRSRTSSFACRL